ncbi:MAG: tRNA (N(6)-L-threonylcarbamoyladenosine(37)-C(2))-methylthiotransferase MtaB [Chlamydiales bacterium]
MEKKFKVVTLGCRTNQSESAVYASQFLKLGYSQAQADEKVDFCIVNTCTVTESADSSSRHEIRQLIRLHPEAKIVVTGCLAERLPEEITKIAGVDLVVSNKDKENLVPLLLPEEEVPEFSLTHFPAHTRAFVKVQDGCNSFCTYCIIPYVRGRSRSRRVEEVVREVEGLVANGYKEVVLTGINIGDFDGNGSGARLATLVRAVDAVEGLKRLRISSIDPDEVDDDLLDAVVNGKNTCPSLHLVLQSGSNLVLKRMNRKYTRQDFFASVEKLKKAHPDFTFTTDIIVGFPGETDQDFAETLEVMEEVKFAKVHMFPYSERARTRAALFPNKISKEVIHERKQKVLRFAERHAFELRQNYVGRTMSVLVENAEEGMGHTENFLPVLAKLPGLKSNDIVRVRCTENHPEGLVGYAD